MNTQGSLALAKQVGEALLSRDFRMVTAESCTGGGVAEAITSVPGSSQWFDRGYVTYSNESKSEVLGVKPKVIDVNGAVSEPVVLAMAKGALIRSLAQVSVAISGVAGPDGGTKQNPVGTVWFAWGKEGDFLIARRQFFTGDRDAIRWQSIDFALKNILDFI